MKAEDVSDQIEQARELLNDLSFQKIHDLSDLFDNQIFDEKDDEISIKANSPIDREILLSFANLLIELKNPHKVLNFLNDKHSLFFHKKSLDE